MGKNERTQRTDGIIFQHREGLVRARAAEGAVVARHGHGDEADGYGAGFGFWGLFVLAVWLGAEGEERGKWEKEGV